MQEFVTYYVTNSGVAKLQRAVIRHRRTNRPPLQAAGLCLSLTYFLSLSPRLLCLPPPAKSIAPASTPMAKMPK